MDAAAEVGRLGRSQRVGGLDGVRGLAIAAVVGYHAFPGAIPGGFLGVEMFFVLSGFLIASAIVGEQCCSGRIGLATYVRRRVARVLPALVFVLLGVVLLGRYLIPEDAHRVPGDVLASVTGLMNWHLVQDGSSYFRELGRPSLLRHLWSLAIEIQFYAVCPFIVAFLARRRPRVGLWCLYIGIAASAVAMTLLAQGDDPSRAYFGTEARIGALLTGVLLAFLVPSPGEGPVRRYAISSGVLWLGGGAVLAGLVLFVNDQHRFLYPGVFLVSRVATVALIVSVLRPGGGPPALRSPAMRWLGQRSYGIFLWHWPILAVTRPGIDVAWPPWVSGVAAVAGACILGEISYRFVEAPFLRPRRTAPAPVAVSRWSALRWSAVSVAVTGTALVTALLPSTDPIAETLELGAEVVSAQALPTPTPVAAAPDTTASPDPQAEAPTRALPVTAIGDSVMLGAAGQLQARLGTAGYVDATINRQLSEGIKRARRLREQGRLGEVVVVHLGTNGPPSAGDVDKLMEALAGVRHVRFVNVRVNRPWQQATNQALAEAVARHAPRAQLVDWYARSEGRREWFLSDGTHLRAPGAEAYADLIAASLPAPPSAPEATVLTRTQGTAVD